MKNFQFIFYLLFLLLPISCNKKPIRTLTVTIDESINKEAQWVYWMSLHGNEFNIIDSCFIEQGQKDFVLTDRVMNDSISKTDLIFSETSIPWVYSGLTVDPTDGDIKVNNLTSAGFYQNGCTIEGAFAEQEIRKLNLERRQNDIKLSELMDDLQLVDFGDTIAVAKIVRERDSLKQYLTQTYFINRLDSVKYIVTIQYLLSCLTFEKTRGNVPKATYDSIVLAMLDRYPKNVEIIALKKHHILGERATPPSERSKYWQKRKESIKDYTYFKNKNKLTDGITVPGKKERRAPGIYVVEPDTSNVTVYTIGAKVDHLRLKDPKDKYIPISSLKTDYILIDFWAIWCAPCVAEIPNILKVHNKYKDKFSVYAISLDNTRQE